MLIDINGIQVNFPFEPYTLQRDYMTKVIEALDNQQNAVLESPTGTGKTLCLLTSTIAWMLKKRDDISGNYKQEYQKQVQAVTNKLDIPQQLPSNFGLPSDESDIWNALNSDQNKCNNWMSKTKIIYTSRTHSQLAQAMKELKMTEYNHVKGVALGSRDQLCINEDVLKEASTSAEKIHLCRAKVKAKQCVYHSRVEKTLESHEVKNEAIMDIEDLVKVGKGCKACPYYLSKQLSNDADIVFLPYNYVLDPKFLKNSKLTLEKSVVILDEAHNVEKVCQDAASAQIASSDIATCAEDLTAIMKQLQKNEDAGLSFMEDDEESHDFTVEDCAKLKEMVLALEQQIDEIPQVTTKGRTFPGGKIFEILINAQITQETFNSVLALIGSLLEFLTKAGAGKIFARKGYGLVKLEELLNTVYGSMTQDLKGWKETTEKGYRLHVELEEPKKKKNFANSSTSDGWLSTKTIQSTLNNNAKVLNYWCFNPGFGMSNLLNRNVHSIILTSGTLAPLKPLVSELALPVKCQLENPHIIKPNQILARIISQGPDGNILNANFQNRDNPKYIHSLGLTIKTIAQFTPNGLLVFFPSYTLMNKTQEVWNETRMWQAINDVKPIFTEPRKKEEFDECMAEYYNAVKVSKGAIFMAVLRGKVSEGLDFKDQNGRAVIIIGLPFAPYMDPRVVLKKEYLQINRNQVNQLQDPQSWYNMDATRAVNQAIGRVIRHKDDYGAIFLCDQRFNTYKNGLSRWVQEHLKQPQQKFSFGPIIKEIVKFFRNAGDSLPKPNETFKTDQWQLKTIKIEDQKSKEKLNNILKRQIKIENSNEMYGSGSNNSNQSSIDYEAMKSFIKKEEKPKNFFSGLSKDVSTIDFNNTGVVASSSQNLLKTSPQSVEENASKRRKFVIVPNNKTSLVGSVMINEPVTVRKEIYEQEVPVDRSDFLNSMKRAFLPAQYKLLLEKVSNYTDKKNFEEFWNDVMPIFKQHVDHICILRGLRRFLIPNHKILFDSQMSKHFIVV
ncbi:CLUMA_CG017228, isoform A [Clunio marinus]|uniref:Regulator of telomere elongation helicase 1 homolog n=1 Tax=Clunio marinus TaxID=568069 RepID=A0A1J1IX31_9DIPT|nr:CLUMA_CG017228, isoform A [Clunio marinus]